jgi:oxaloacetate decarboxylase gamma subunit
METNLVIEGLKFMVLGMGTVLAFIVILIVVMNIQAKIIQRFFPEPKAAAPKSTDSTPSAQPKDNKKIAAIAAAIMHHNKV